MAVVLDSRAGDPGTCGNCTGAWRCLRPAYLDTHHYVYGSGAKLELYWWLYWLFILWQCRILRHRRVYHRTDVTRQPAFLVGTSRGRARRRSLRLFTGTTSAAAERPLLRHCYAWHSRGHARVRDGEGCRWWWWRPDVLTASQPGLLCWLFLRIPGAIPALPADYRFPHAQPFRLCAHCHT